MNCKHHKYIIIGGGPAGLQAAYDLGNATEDYLILEQQDTPGAFFKKFPRHKKLISINKVHTGYDNREVNLRWDWNSLLTSRSDSHLFKEYSEKYFPNTTNIINYLCDFSQKYSLSLKLKADVVSVHREEAENIFIVELSSGEKFSSNYLIVATGLSLPWIPDLPGIETVKSYCDMSMDTNDYKNKKVLILGKGNSAFETADALIEHASMIHMCSPNTLRFAWSSHYVGHVRAVNNNFLDTYHLKSQNAVLDAEILSIEKQASGGFVARIAYKHAENEIEEIFYDTIIACTGFRFDTGMFKKNCLPKLCEREKFPLQTSNWESVNIPNLYFAGTLMQQRDYRRYMSGFIHGFRYNVRTLVKLLLERNSNQSYPSTTLTMSHHALTEWIIDRINNTSALWQQPGFLADVIFPNMDSGTIEILEELPMDYIHDSWGSDNSDFFTLSLEYGLTKFDNPFNVSRISRNNIKKADESNFLHPIIRHYRNNELVSKHHTIENLFAEWQKPEHIEPLSTYLRYEIGDFVQSAVR